jgi:hypothetical protein
LPFAKFNAPESEHFVAVAVGAPASRNRDVTPWLSLLAGWSQAPPFECKYCAAPDVVDVGSRCEARLAAS